MNESPSVSPEKLNSLPQSGSEKSGEILSPLQETVEKISEIMGDTPTSDIQNRSSQNTQHRTKKRIQTPDGPVKIPSVSVQRKAIEKELVAQTEKWERQVKKLRKQRTFSAAKMEVLVKKIREYKALILELLHMTKDALESLYKRFVLKR